MLWLDKDLYDIVPLSLSVTFCLARLAFEFVVELEARKFFRSIFKLFFYC